MLNLIPDGPLSLPADILSGVLDVVKILAAGAVEGLPGLRAMDPTDPGLATWATRPVRTWPATPSMSSSNRPAVCCRWSGSRMRPWTSSSGRKPTTWWYPPRCGRSAKLPVPAQRRLCSGAVPACGTARSSPSPRPLTTYVSGAVPTRDDHGLDAALQATSEGILSQSLDAQPELVAEEVAANHEDFLQASQAGRPDIAYLAATTGRLHPLAAPDNASRPCPRGSMPPKRCSCSQRMSPPTSPSAQRLQDIGAHAVEIGAFGLVFRCWVQIADCSWFAFDADSDDPRSV